MINNRDKHQKSQKRWVYAVDIRNRICIASCESALATQHESKYDAAIRRRHLTNRNARCKTVLAFMILRWATDTRWLINMEKYEWVVPCAFAKVYLAKANPTSVGRGRNTMRILIATVRKKLRISHRRSLASRIPSNIKISNLCKIVKKKFKNLFNILGSRSRKNVWHLLYYTYIIIYLFNYFI